ncbi:MAG TPA: 2OG-Fe(II) oxygenase [Caulobacteraceae bacterium]|jgi:predicted 2-oxoglutarate/Fe(II)-dependent dioxygenase YbiX
MIGMALGQRAPEVAGATRSGAFYSLDLQAGRPAVLLFLHGCGPAAARGLLDALEPALSLLGEAGVDLVPLAPPDLAYARAFDGGGAPCEAAVYTASPWPADQADGPSALVVDRSGRVVHQAVVYGAEDLLQAQARAAARLASEAPRLCRSSAPVLILPNLMTPSDCRVLIDRFEAAEHRVGVMAAVRDGEAVVKLDESKKRRREIQLEPGALEHDMILSVLAERCAPEIKRAFQADIAHADRILVARYDDSGGWFKRHRDNAAPQTAFREFAVSINLNTQDYEGGELLFPEFDDHRYSPPAGSAIIFSASLLHEAAAVTRGARYVALSFLCTAKALERVSA